MKTILGRMGLAAVALGCFAGSAAAQLPGLPVYAGPRGSVGLTINGDFGRGLNDASRKTNLLAARAELGLPMIRLGAGLGVYDPSELSDVPDPDQEIAFEGHAAINVFGGPLIPVAVSLQGGVGFVTTAGAGITGGDVTKLHIPISVGIAVNVPTPGLNIKPWAAPRLQITRTSNGTSDTDVRLGASAGFDFSLPIGLGAHAALDYTFVSAPEGTGLTASEVSPLVFGIGVHFTIGIPSLGVPIVPVI